MRVGSFSTWCAAPDGSAVTKVGVTCALCCSTVDDAVTHGVGRRLDGWATVDLNVGAVVALSPAMDEMTKAEFRSWGPGKYDPRHHAHELHDIWRLTDLRDYFARLYDDGCDPPRNHAGKKTSLGDDSAGKAQWCVSTARVRREWWSIDEG